MYGWGEAPDLPKTAISGYLMSSLQMWASSRQDCNKKPLLIYIYRIDCRLIQRSTLGGDLESS
jgi:hypothetical protein